MRNKLVIVFISIFAAAILVGCGTTHLAIHERITHDEAVEMMAYQNVIILDVRTLDEFNTGHIPNAVSLPVDEIVDAVTLMIPDKEQIILIYCRNGRRSADATAILVDMGYRGVFDFGCIIDWTGEIQTVSH